MLLVHTRKVFRVASHTKQSGSLPLEHISRRGSRPTWLSPAALEQAPCIRSSSATQLLLNSHCLSGPICKIGYYSDQAQVSTRPVARTALVPLSGSLSAASLWHRDKQDRCACCLWLAAR